MNFRKIKHKIAIDCKGDLDKYFRKIEIINKMIKKDYNITEREILQKIDSK